ncbi:MAG: DUF454 family protein [Anaerolineae bacterium]
MDNPWLHIPVADYEGHMSDPHIDQQQFLATTFKETLERHDSTSIALLGCATGNGLEYVNSDVTRKLTAVDVNPQYLEILRYRYERCVSGLEVVEADLDACVLESSTYTLIFAGLIFEYVDPRMLLPKIAGWLCPDGVMVAVLQLPAEGLPEVSESRYTSLKALKPIMKLVSPEEFKLVALEAGLCEVKARVVTLESGKAFYIGTYSRAKHSVEQSITMMNRAVRILMVMGGTICVALGIIGVFLPVLPTTPFLLLAAVLYARSSQRFYHWLLSNRLFGGYLSNYRAGRGIPLAHKVMSILLLWLTIGFAAVFVVQAWWLRLVLVVVACGVTWHLVRVKTMRPKS